MEESTAQINQSNEEFKSFYDEKHELDSPGSSPVPQPSAMDSIKDSNQVNAITVLTLLDKLVNMLDSVQEKQYKMEKKQIDIENSVKGIQSDITKLSKNHTSTSNTVSKLMEKSRKVSDHMRHVKDNMDKQTVQVKKLENNHTQLLRRNNFKVLIFQEENEIPTNIFVKDPTPVPSITEGLEESTDPNKSQDVTMHTIDLSSDDDINLEEALDIIDEDLEQTRAEKIKRSSLKKVDSLKKAFSRQNIEKKMSKIGTKIVSPERREKIKKSFTQSQNKSSKSSSFKVPSLALSVKKTNNTENPEEDEGKSSEQTEAKESLVDTNVLNEKASEIPSALEEVQAIVDKVEATAEEILAVNNNIQIYTTEDEDAIEQEFENENPFSVNYNPEDEDVEESHDLTQTAA
ncbi:hypothetical protein GDO86_014166 [Hymenochirus boettgeri]|uniref:Uncharacterized protein n=1 Tax=Hymenochirus boettgeri TaxID=247094 RepID=A0A8T2JT67_9PIPI|nr:hypothetical protein GDO86_014166 [Hymenochirus boettgeri]